MVESKIYVPARGDLVWLDFSPQAGHEQAGRRPAVCLSPVAYNKKVGLALFCPVTTAIKGYPFEVLLPSSLPITGVILCDQLKSMDWKSRQVKSISTLPEEIMNQVLAKTRSLV